ncbi:MAG: FAD-dependent oxidoreductase, partial [Cloacibacterium sp.]|nr:FAD-dependent oxidoreductase [Cloacibacterium sp.]
MEKRDKIIVVGGGFAGLQFARKLNGKIEKKVMVIDKANHHMFQPLFYQVACGRIEPSNISFPFRKIFQRSKNIQFRMTDVKEIIPSEHKIITEDATFHYDKLVIATGCKTNFFGNQKMESLAYGMKNTQEAISIRNHILLTFEKLIIKRKSSDDG